MNVLSLFDGMSCGRIALERVGIKVDNYFASEIDKYAIQVSKANYSDIVHIGDVTKVYGGYISQKIDLLIGGSPCQGLSIGNKNRKLLNDVRSKLFYEYIRLLNETKPKYFLLENVLMDADSENEFTRLTGVSSIMINSKSLSAQRRERLYWTNIPNVSQPIDKGILFKDILDNDFSKYILSDTLQGRFKLLHDDNGTKLVIGTTKIEGKIGQRDRVYGINNKIPTLTATDYKQPKQLYVNGVLRKTTPIECERLQTITDNYTKCVSDMQRYKMLGNGWTVDVIAHIFSYLK